MSVRVLEQQTLFIRSKSQADLLFEFYLKFYGIYALRHGGFHHVTARALVNTCLHKYGGFTHDVLISGPISGLWLIKFKYITKILKATMLTLPM